MKRLQVIFGAATAITAVTAADAAMLDNVRSRGELVCGTDATYAGFALPDANGTWKGFNVDMCKALAAGLRVKHRIRPLTSNERFVALASGEADVLTMQNTWTMSRDTKLGVRMVATTYYDVQSFLVKKAINAKVISDLDGATACVISGSTAEINLADQFKARKLTYTPVTFKSEEESRLAYDAGRCDFILGDRAKLANIRSQLSKPEENVLFDESFGREPLSITIRQGDEAWFSIVRWTYFTLVAAEHLGVTQENVVQFARDTNDAETANLLGKSGSLWTDVGLDKDYAVRVLQAVGNYGEIWERNIGPESPLGLSRGINALWTDGGLQYAPPFK